MAPRQNCSIHVYLKAPYLRRITIYHLNVADNNNSINTAWTKTTTKTCWYLTGSVRIFGIRHTGVLQLGIPGIFRLTTNFGESVLRPFQFWAYWGKFLVFRVLFFRIYWYYHFPAPPVDPGLRFYMLTSKPNILEIPRALIFVFAKPC